MVGNFINNSLFVYPTDTVWGIGGSIYSLSAYEKIAWIKNTEKDKPVSILFSSIATLKNYFEIFLNEEELNVFFKLESTLCLDLVALKKEYQIPSWIYQKSPMVAVRCLDLPWIREIIHEVGGGPVITTSLNLHGQAPIVSHERAKAFVETVKSRVGLDLPLVIKEGEKSEHLSGTSSSIVHLSHSGKMDFLREGNRAQEIRKLFFRLFST